MGILCQLDHPKLEETIESVRKTAKARSLPAGIANDAIFLTRGAAAEIRKLHRG